MFMEKNEFVTVRVAPVYHNADLYRAMPRPVFDALEAAFLGGRETAELPAPLYDEFANALPPYLRPLAAGAVVAETAAG